ncbi:MAG: hypothetical protein ABSC08_04980 [Bryobacteraceae bacterium]
MPEGPDYHPVVQRPHPSFDAAQQQAIRRELTRILESPFFRATRRSQECLRFIVEKTLEGTLDQLKERCIGVEVLGRATNYDTNSDAAVRIIANDLRKRLAQYETSGGEDSAVTIHLPPGSYVPEFRWRHPAAHKEPQAPGQLPPAPAPRPPAAARIFRSPQFGRLLRNRVFHWSAAAVLLAVAVLALLRGAPKSPLELFWGPVLSSPSPAIITIGQSTVYVLSQRVHELYCAGNSEEVESRPHVVNYGDASIPGKDIVPVTDSYTRVNDAMALARLTEMFGRFGKPVRVRLGNQTSFSDMRDAPMILLGFNNRLNQDVALQFRFTFGRLHNLKVMTDKTPPGRVWSIEVDPAGHTVADYGLISRVVNAETGQFVVQAGGLASFGTRSVGEFLTNSQYWGRLLQDLPRDWPSRNIQIVIRVKVVNNATSVPEVVSSHCW